MSGEKDRSDRPESVTPGANSKFNFDDLERRLGGDRESAIAVLRAFAQDAPNQLTRLRQAVEADDFKQVRLAAHTLKGGLLWIGADEAAASAHVLEQNPSRGSALAPSASLSKLTTEVEQLLTTLRSSSEITMDRSGSPDPENRNEGRDPRKLSG